MQARKSVVHAFFRFVCRVLQIEKKVIKGGTAYEQRRTDHVIRIICYKTEIEFVTSCWQHRR